MRTEREIRMSGFARSATSAEIQRLPPMDPGQHYPERNPQEPDPLGEPIPIREVAHMLGVSPWTVRQRYLPQGLPHFRSGPQGKLVFFRQQVIHWILERQQKGGCS
jgi:phage terminase Nu1 subunit (DNA packaging protein)